MRADHERAAPARDERVECGRIVEDHVVRIDAARPGGELVETRLREREHLSVRGTPASARRALALLSLFEMHEGVDTIPLLPELRRSIGLIARDRDPPSPLLAASWSIFRGCNLEERFDTLISGAY